MSKVKAWCEKCQKKTAHELRQIEDQECLVCLKCEGKSADNKKMLDIVGYIDPRERYSLRPDRAFEEDRMRIGRPF